MKTINPVLRLCLKDFTANKGAALLVAALYVPWLALAVIVEGKFSLTAIIFPILALEGLNRFEDKYKTGQLFCSLPVKRSAIVYAKYLSSLAIIIFTVLLSYMTALLLETLLPVVPQSAGKIITAGRLFSFLFIYALFTAVSLHIYSRFGYLGYPMGIIVDFLLTIAAAVSTWGILYAIVSLLSGSWELAQYRGGGGAVDGFIDSVTGKTIDAFGKSFFFIFLSLLTAAVMYASISASLKYYRERDL